MNALEARRGAISQRRPSVVFIYKKHLLIAQIKLNNVPCVHLQTVKIMRWELFDLSISTERLKQKTGVGSV